VGTGATEVGAINITGPEPAGGNAHNSVGILSRAGFGAAAQQPQGTNWGREIPLPHTGNNLTSDQQAANDAVRAQNEANSALWDSVAKNWEDFLVTRPAEFWGTGNSLGDGRPGTQGFIVNSTVGSTTPPSIATQMQQDYATWAEFRAFLPRDRWFAYPILYREGHGYLYRLPDEVTQGAHRLYDDSDHEATVRATIPWVDVNTPPNSPWNGTYRQTP
jgi:hypothetical protein